jgi:hypothetical protein
MSSVGEAPDLTSRSVAELGRLYRAILAELRRRGVIRTGNAPIGDYAEWLVAQATQGELAPNSQKSWDIETPEGEHLQVKSRFVTDPTKAGERQLSPFRSWDFDAAVIVLFDDEFGVWRAAKIDREVVKDGAAFIEHVNGYRVIARDDLLAVGEDWSDRLRVAADQSS